MARLFGMRLLLLALVGCGSGHPNDHERPDAAEIHADASRDTPQIEPDAPLPVKLVFLTGPVTGNLNGPIGADEVCAMHAQGLSGTFRAWISGDTGDATARMTHSSIPYALVDGEIVANDWADLIDGTLHVPLDRDEHGDLSSATMVWTATNYDGTGNELAANCNNWSFVFDDTNPVGAVGDPRRASPEWTNAGQLVDCLSGAGLYCIEQ